MESKSEPTPQDDLEEAEAKSKSVDERIPDALPPQDGSGLNVPVAGAYVPQQGIGAPVGGPVQDPGNLGPGEQVLEQERKATRAKIQRG